MTKKRKKRTFYTYAKTVTFTVTKKPTIKDTLRRKNTNRYT